MLTYATVRVSRTETVMSTVVESESGNRRSLLILWKERTGREKALSAVNSNMASPCRGGQTKARLVRSAPARLASEQCRSWVLCHEVTPVHTHPQHFDATPAREARQASTVPPSLFRVLIPT